MSEKIKSLVAQNRSELNASAAPHTKITPIAIQRRGASQDQIARRGRPATPPGFAIAQAKRRIPSAITTPTTNLVAQASARQQLKALRPKTRNLGLMPVGRAVFGAVPMDTMISLSNSLGAELGLSIAPSVYEGSTRAAPATALFCKDLWTLQAVALWVTDGMCYAGQFPTMSGIITKKGHNPNDLSPLISTTGHALFDLTPLLGNEVWGPDGIFGRQAESVVLSFNRGEFAPDSTGSSVFGKKINTDFDNGPKLQATLDRIFAGVNSTRINDDSLQAGPVAISAACDELSTAAAAAAKNCEVRKDPTTGAEKKPYTGEDLLGGKDSVPSASTGFPWGWVVGGTLVVGGLAWYFWPKSENDIS